MQAGETPGVRVVVLRALRLACPACGGGALYERRFKRADRCSRCGWVFERGAGFWVGGAELNMFASYGLSVLLFMPVLVFAPSTPALMAGVIAGHVACSLLLFRLSRALFLGLDYLLDPGRPAGPDDDGGAGQQVRPRPPARGARVALRRPRPTGTASGRVRQRCRIRA